MSIRSMRLVVVAAALLFAATIAGCGGSSPSSFGSTDGGADTDTDTDTGTEAGCGEGVLLYGICWYFGALGDSCNETCDLHGGYDEATPEYVGIESQGGSLEECQAIFTALGSSETVSEGSNSAGYGCHFWQGSGLWWLNSPAFDPSASADAAREVCGCLGDAIGG